MPDGTFRSVRGDKVRIRGYSLLYYLKLTGLTRSDPTHSPEFRDVYAKAKNRLGCVS